ncbi:MAG: hypothetical protein Q8N26_04245 [Myxococcales bacterium]|nr:hypothetical protein [Myxococcales bacterium]
MTPTLDTFLTEFAAMLDGRRTAREVESVLGPSPSGTARLGLYATLVQRQQTGAIDEFYAAVRVAAPSGYYEPLRNAYLEAYPPSHWAPARAAEHFPVFLEARKSSIELVELADFAWTRHLVLNAEATDALVVRHYTHAVKRFSNEVERDGRTRGRPEKDAETWLMGRSLLDGNLVMVEPSVAALVTVEVLHSGGWSDELPAIPRGVLLKEAERLIELGLLPPTSRAVLERLVP